MNKAAVGRLCGGENLRGSGDPAGRGRLAGTFEGGADALVVL